MLAFGFEWIKSKNFRSTCSWTARNNNLGNGRLYFLSEREFLFSAEEKNIIAARGTKASVS